MTSARRELREAEQLYTGALQHYGALGHVEDPGARLANVERSIVADEAALAAARNQIGALRAEPTLRAQPAEVLDLARTRWAAQREHRAAWLAVRATVEALPERRINPPDRSWAAVPQTSTRDRGDGISR